MRKQSLTLISGDRASSVTRAHTAAPPALSLISLKTLVDKRLMMVL